MKHRTLFVYCIGMFIALAAYFLLHLTHDSSYLHARIAQNLIEGEGFVYNSDEGYLVTAAPLLVMVQAAIALPSGSVIDSPEMLNIVLVGVLLAGLMAELAFNRRWLWAGLVAGLMVLITPIGIIFVAELFIFRATDRHIGLSLRYAAIAFLPPLLWYGFALIYFSAEGIRGLILPSAEVLPNSAALLMVSLALFLGVMRFQNLPRGVYWGGIGIFVLAIIVTSDASAKSVQDSEATKGIIGTHQDAFLLGGDVYHLDGRVNPHLYELAQADDRQGIIIATAPDVLLLPPDANPMGYRFEPEQNVWGREFSAQPWGEMQAVNLAFGPDMHLKDLAQDRILAEGGDWLRLRLDWQLPNGIPPDKPINFAFNLLDYQGASVGFAENVFQPEKWKALRATTYHLLPINADALAGRYTVQLTLGFDGGVIDQLPIATLKIPLPNNVQFADPPLATFDDGAQSASLMTAEIVQNENDISVALTWRAESDFTADYTIFVHLTAPDDAVPLAQGDSQPQGGRYPTSLWAAGEVIQDQYALNITDLPAGEYMIRVGFFHPERGRLATDEGDAYIIREVRIQP